ncbi:hypothetical protein ACMFMG_000508 [Clarireedia jacksonii]
MSSRYETTKPSNTAMKGTAMSGLTLRSYSSGSTSISTSTPKQYSAATNSKLSAERIQRWLADTHCTTPYASRNTQSISAMTTNSSRTCTADTYPYNPYPSNTCSTYPSATTTNETSSTTQPARFQSTTHTTHLTHHHQPASTTYINQTTNIPPHESTYPPSIVHAVLNMHSKLQKFDDAFNRHDQR